MCRNTSYGQKKRNFEIGTIDEVYAPPLKAIKLVQDISSEEQRPQKEKLEHESRDIMLKFLILRNKFFKSLKDELLDDLVRGLECIKVHVEPIPADSIRQKVSFEDIRKNIKTVEAVKDVIESYSSFYCYEVLATMIESFGTEEDKGQLKNYTDNFKEYARRRVYKCSSITGSTYTSQDSELFIKLDSLYDRCSLNFLKRFHWNLSTLLGISFKTLRLCRIEDGCIELFFAIARFIQEAIFPLTDKQESELRRLHVTRLSCGSYHFMNIAQVGPNVMIKSSTHNSSNPYIHFFSLIMKTIMIVTLLVMMKVTVIVIMVVMVDPHICQREVKMYNKLCTLLTFVC